MASQHSRNVISRPSLRSWDGARARQSECPVDTATSDRTLRSELWKPYRQEVLILMGHKMGHNLKTQIPSFGLTD